MSNVKSTGSSISHTWLWILPWPFASYGTLSKSVNLSRYRFPHRQNRAPLHRVVLWLDENVWKGQCPAHNQSSRNISTTSSSISFSFPIQGSKFDQVRGRNWSQEVWQVRIFLKAVVLALQSISQIPTVLSTTETFVPNTHLLGGNPNTGWST